MAATYEASLVAVTPQASGQPTFSEICAINWTGLSILEELAAPGSCSIATPVDRLEQVGKDRLRDLKQTPCELWVRRTTLPSATSIVFAGEVTGVQLQNRTLTLTAPGLLNYLQAWLADINVLAALNGGTPTAEYVFNLVDQATIVQRLADAWQAQSYAHNGIVTTGLSATGVPRQLTLSSVEGKFIMPLITSMGVRNNGFDLTVDPATRKLTMWSPRKGNNLTNNVFFDQRTLANLSLAWSVAPGTIGSEVFASSSSTQGATITSIKSNTALRATLGRSYVTRSYSDISDQATLDDHAQRQADDMSTQVFIMDADILPVIGMAYGDFSTGDLVSYDYDAGVGRQTFAPRIASIQTTVTSGREMLRVGIL